MEFPSDTNGDVLRRMHAADFNFAVPHEIEFFAIFRTEAEADSVASEFLADHKSGDRLKNVETRPAIAGGMELRVVKEMLVTHENIAGFECRLARRVAKHDGYLDGWGVLQE